jgi:hypothetical protein
MPAKTYLIIFVLSDVGYPPSGMHAQNTKPRSAAHSAPAAGPSVISDTFSYKYHEHQRFVLIPDRQYDRFFKPVVAFPSLKGIRDGFHRQSENKPTGFIPISWTCG